VTLYRIKFEGPADLAVRIATELADADGVDLTSSKPPTVIDERSVSLDMTVEANEREVSAALAAIRDDLPSGASIEIIDD